MMHNNKIYVTKPSMPPYEEYIEMIKPLWDSHNLTNMGIYHNRLEEELQKYLGVNHLELMTNGHMALEMAIQAMGLKGEVITSPFTFVSTTHAIVRNGLTPVFCDINEEDYTIDTNKIERLITDKTSAIVPVHVYGRICDVENIAKIANKFNLKVIYDAAHAFGVKYKGKSVAQYGDASILSFHATKVFNTIEGGAVIFEDEKLGKTLYGLKNFGIRNETVIDSVGANAKMDEFRAIMGICNLKYIEQELEKRKAITLHYRKLLNNIKGIRILQEQEDVISNYAYFPIIIEEHYGKTRDEVYQILSENNIYARKYFYPVTNDCICYSNLFEAGNTPVAKYISEHVLTLPLYADLSYDDVERICKVIKYY